MYIVCILYVYCMYIVCKLYVYCMYIVCILYYNYVRAPMQFENKIFFITSTISWAHAFG
jgi:hypothetical protein